MKFLVSLTQFLKMKKRIVFVLQLLKLYGVTLVCFFACLKSGSSFILRWVIQRISEQGNWSQSQESLTFSF